MQNAVSVASTEAICPSIPCTGALPSLVPMANGMTYFLKHAYKAACTASCSACCHSAVRGGRIGGGGPKVLAGAAVVDFALIAAAVVAGCALGRFLS